MSNTLVDLKRGIKKEKRARSRRVRFISYVVATVSILLGAFILLAPGWLTGIAQPFLVVFIPYEAPVAFGLIIPSIGKIAGMHAGARALRRLSIHALSFVWGGMFILSVAYSFGIGYPDPWFIFTGAILALCWRVAFGSGA